MLRVDGSYGEGGGQLLRTAVALAAIVGQPIEIHHIRVRRRPPGLAPQHLLAVRALLALCSGRAEGLELRSPALRFFPGALAGGHFAFDIGTAGSVTLVLQALMPAMLSARAESLVRVRGGTDVRGAPPIAYLERVLLPLLRRMQAHVHLEVPRHGYYPRGGGEVEIAVQPSSLQPLALEVPGALLAIEGEAHAARLPEHIALRMRKAAVARLPADATIDIRALTLGDGQASGTGGAIVLWARCRDTILGAARVAERGIPAEHLGEGVALELLNDLAAGATIDVHGADQLLVYLALAGGGSLRAREVTSHARTAMWLIEQFLPVRFSTEQRDSLVRISVAPR